MKIPEPFFILINPAVRLLLHSPLHWLLSRSVMTIKFTGRISGREFETPVRFIRNGDTIQCFTGRSNQWWRNMRNSAEVVLRITGNDAKYRMCAVWSEPERVKQSLTQLLKEFPQDAPYYDIHMLKSGTPDPSELDAASINTVLVEAEIAH